MNSRPNILVLIAALGSMLTANIQAQTTNPPYLGQFPSVEHVQAEIKGTDAMDTAARQMGAFWQLRRVIETLAGPRSYRGATPDEGRLIGQYNYGYQLASQPIEKSLPPGDRARWYKMHSFYESDDAFLDELFKRFFSTEFRTGYYRVTGKQPPSATSQPTTRPTAPPTAPTTSASGSANAYLAQGDKYRAAKNYVAAVEAYGRAIAVQPSAGAYNRIGLVYRDLKQYPKAVDAFQQAVRLKPDDATLRKNLGTAYIDMKQYENAIVATREAIRLKPDYVDAFNQLGNAYYGLDQYSEAVAAYKEAVRLQPNYAPYLSNLGFAYIELGMKEETLKVHQALQKIDQAEAKELYQKIDSSYAKTDDPLDNMLFGAMLFQAGGYKEALRAFRRVIVQKAVPDRLGSAHDWIGKVYNEQKKYKQAKEEFEKAAAAYQQAIRLAPRNAENYLNLGKVYLELGQKDQALRVYRTLQTIDKAKAQKLYAEINKSK